MSRPEHALRGKRGQIVALYEVRREDHAPVFDARRSFLARDFPETLADWQGFIPDDILVVNHVRRDVCFDHSPAESRDRDEEQDTAGQFSPRACAVSIMRAKFFFIAATGWPRNASLPPNSRINNFTSPSSAQSIRLAPPADVSPDTPALTTR